MLLIETYEKQCLRYILDGLKDDCKKINETRAKEIEKLIEEYNAKISSEVKEALAVISIVLIIVLFMVLIGVTK